MKQTMIGNTNQVLQTLMNDMIEPCIFALAVKTGGILEFDLPTIISATTMIHQLAPKLGFIPEFLTTWSDSKKQMKRVQDFLMINEVQQDLVTRK
jgi:hypothetical protein